MRETGNPHHLDWHRYRGFVRNTKIRLAASSTKFAPDGEETLPAAQTTYKFSSK